MTAIGEPWAACRDSDAPAPFLLVGFDPAVRDRLVVVAAGSGGDALRAALPDDAVIFGGLGFKSEGMRRFAFFTWVGPAVTGMRRARVSMSKAGAYSGKL